MHRYFILFLFFKYKMSHVESYEDMGNLPSVTIQLPVYNEMYVVERLINAAAKLQYPKELVEIQVLDDSTDETSTIAKRIVQNLRTQGYKIKYMHRDNRKGFKAGALQAGLEKAKGELIAIFDADFIPKKDFLFKMIPCFSDSKVGMVQSRWGHINQEYSLFTRLQAMFLDAHFILEHTARYWSGRFFNFNGTAGIWRKKCLISAGGWQYDTLTEDLDLSYRAQLMGWKFIFMPDVVTPGEIPVDIHSFKTQQHRWAKGGIETTKKLLPLIVKSHVPLRIKLESIFHLTANMNYLFLLILSLLAFPALVIRIVMQWKYLFLFDLVFFLGATLPVGLYYIVSQREIYQKWQRKIFFLPLLMALGIGICVNNGKAVLEALLGYRSAFLRTPKFRIQDKSDTWRYKRYRAYTAFLMMTIELMLGSYFFCAVLFALYQHVYAAIPFLMMFCFGFFYVSLLSLYQHITSYTVKSASVEIFNESSV